MIDDLVAPFESAYMQRAVLEVVLLSIPAGVLGAWIVMRHLAFFVHAVGTATFPGLVLAGPWGVPAPLMALASGSGLAVGVERLVRGRRVASDAATGILLVGALAVGVVLASDVYGSGASVDRLLFGTVLGLTTGHLLLTAIVALAAVAIAASFGRAWLSSTFDEASAGSLRTASPAADLVLYAGLVGVVVVAVDAAGVLLVGALLVTPAATASLVARSVLGLQAGAVVLALALGVAGLWCAHQLDVPPGPAIAVLSAGVFALTAFARA